MLGESITVQTGLGALVRVNGADADALGLDPPEQQPGPAPTESFSMSQVVDALQDVYDPEIPVSVVELGLIYRCDEELLADGSRLISIDMSMTAPGCGMGDVLRADAERVVRMVPGVDDVEVTLVWDPPWNINRMSEEVRLQLGLL
jgi:probable FeS assembly SUF system protein SufT